MRELITDSVMILFELGLDEPLTYISNDFGSFDPETRSTINMQTEYPINGIFDQIESNDQFKNMSRSPFEQDTLLLIIHSSFIPFEPKNGDFVLRTGNGKTYQIEGYIGDPVGAHWEILLRAAADSDG